MTAHAGEARHALAAIERLLHRTIGLDVATVGERLVEASVNRRVVARGVAGIPQYAALVQSDPDELQELVEAVVIPETFFFRERSAFDVMLRWIDTTRRRADPGPPLRLLSVPCSTGEEAYSIVMALLGAGHAPESFVVRGVDVSRDAIRRATAGVYRAGSFRGADLQYRALYFDEGPTGFTIASRVRDRARFTVGNLLASDLILPEAAYDVIFCRNLLIYFDTETQIAVLRTIERWLAPNGLLLSGAADTFAMRRGGFVPAGGAFPLAFTREANRAASPADRAVRARRTARPPAPRTPSTIIPPAITPPARRVIATRPPDTAAAVPASAPTLEQTRALADRGDLTEAVRAGERLLAAGVATTDAFSLVGAIHDALGDSERAERYYRRALFLDPGHVESLMHLAALVAGRGDQAGAARLRARARRGGGSQ